MLDLVIIGAGPAGLAACLYASRAGLEVLVLDQGAPGGKLNVSAQIENYPGQECVAGPQLAYQMYEQALSFGGKQTYGIVEKVIDYGSYKEVKCHDETYQTKYVLIASGTKERKMNLEHEEELTGRGISYCAVCDGPFFKDEEVAVIGGGNSALEESLYLATICKQVHLIVRRDVFRADQIIVDRVLKDDKIKVHLKHSPFQILQENKKVAGLVIQNNETLEKEQLKVTGIFPFIGLDPITDFVDDLKITNEQGYIPTDEHMETKVKGIFAAGDVREKTLRQVVTAVNDGAIAGQYISNLKKEGNEDE
ncbi:MULTISPECIES: thioredoxin-disulfide reductase [Coprobacillaceae]|uniref:thioredoxin-disulfide reductase n=1 Tax=Coprobacillaceae TaxID=2810280 RepID=UPI000E4BCA14|nr:MULTISPECIES: thioredoxin-disulfide reductase [Coprobacillaceae]RHM61020.1 thioredoxin-disulfide reductase [Coprobacillus sp. AF33-1AC]RHS94848.1 thioredoxin-disulfide reductase [Erysipelatoclostridium sp. AM42-17]